jgi:hypothetical protein
MNLCRTKQHWYDTDLLLVTIIKSPVWNVIIPKLNQQNPIFANGYDIIPKLNHQNPIFAL